MLYILVDTGFIMETYVYAIIGLLVLVIVFLFLRGKKPSGQQLAKTNKSGRDTINAVNSNVNTGAGDQSNNK
jgi:hypothetical protein